MKGFLARGKKIKVHPQVLYTYIGIVHRELETLPTVDHGTVLE